jgi:hypothetical protein
MGSIGGYFGLELRNGVEYHGSDIRLNTGRNALEYILRSRKYSKLYLPYFTCDVLLQPLARTGTSYEFYHIDNNLEPSFEFARIKDDEGFLYTNYFGLKDKYISALHEKCPNLIVDNAQAFYALPLQATDTFYSARKFFGVPDGAYLYTNKPLDVQLKKDVSYDRFEHLLRRIDIGAENGYPFFVKNDNLLGNVPLLTMSTITRSILSSIDYRGIAEKRKINYHYLHSALKMQNQLSLELDNQVPMVYPFYATPVLREKLANNKIYTAAYWPNVLDWVPKKSLESDLASNIIHLPIDQRISVKELDEILNIVLN